MRIFLCIWIAALYSYSAHATELLINGDFSNGITGWQEEKSASFSLPTDATISVNSDGKLKITGVSGSNYSLAVSQDIYPQTSATQYKVSFDWKSTSRDTPWGSNGIRVDFYDSTDALLGRIYYKNTGQVNRGIEQIQGTLPDNMFIGVLKNAEVHDWESVNLTTENLTGMDHSKIHKINARIHVHNDAGSGGELFVDNFSVTPSDCYDTGFSAGFAAGIARCKEDPASCGISNMVSSQNVTISPNLNIHIPTADYQFLGGSMSLWADLQFVPNADNRLLWELTDYGVNQ